MKKKIVLIYPELAGDRTTRILPLSLVYVAGGLTRDFDVCLIDQRVENNWRQRLLAEIQGENLLCVGISSMTGPQIAAGIEAARLVREQAPKTPIVWGGVHPSLLPEETAQHDGVDIVVVGDGEETFPELVKALASGIDLQRIPGLVFKRDGEIVASSRRQKYDIRQMPFPQYDLVDVNAYKTLPGWTDRPSLPLITSRGCPYNCGYCYNTRFSDRRWLALDAATAVEWMLELVNRYHVDGIFLLDDNFFTSLERVEAICQALLQKKPGLRIFNANCRADTIMRMDSELLNLLKRAGFDQLFIGVESGSQRILEKIHKDLEIKQTLAANRKLQMANIQPFFSFMAGFPFEERRDVEQTLELMRRLLRDNPAAIVYKLQLYTPFPGTELFESVREQGMKTPASLAEWAGYHYDRLNLDCFSPGHRRFLSDIQFYSAFLDKKLSRDKKNLRKWIAYLYSQIFSLRIRTGWYSMLYELRPWQIGQSLKRRFHSSC